MALTVFAADDGTHGRELWRTDGTAAGTMLLKDILPGSASSSPHDFVNTSTGAYFIVQAGLWRTDGTASGTFYITDVPGISHLTSAGDRLYFTTYYSSNSNDPNQQLWTSDGTATGTMPIPTGNASASPYLIGNLTGAGGRLFFTAANPVAGTELWSSDGTAAGTQLLRDINAGAASSYPSSLTAIGAKLFFAADDGVSGRELWVTGISPGTTTLVRDIGLGSAGSDPTDLTNVDGVLYFHAKNADGTRVWRSDGTANGTVELPTGTVIPTPSGSGVSAGTDVAHGTELWTRSGSASAFLADINPLSDPSASFIDFDAPLAVLNGRLIFSRSDGETSRFNAVAHGRELWTSDGTAGGTSLLADINPTSYVAGLLAGGTIAYGSSNPASFTRYNGQLYFSATDGQIGRELWRTDGTTAGTVLVSDILPGSTGSNPTNLVNAGQLYFIADDGHGAALYRSDGSAQGTTVVHASGGGFAPTNLIATTSGLTFTSGSQLWRSDGTAAGTSVVVDLAASGSSAPTDLHAQGAAVTFRTTGSNGATELWSTDGSAAGTQRVATLDPGDRTGIANLTVGNGALYFTASTAATGVELWRTNATGTALLVDLNPGAGSSSPANLITVGDRLYFTANDGVHGTELWSSDGTSAGTVVLDIAPGAASSGPANLSAVDGLLYLTAATSASGREVWRTDGTPAGTVQVSEIRTAFSSNPDGFTTLTAPATYARPDLFGTVAHDASSAGGKVFALYDGILGRAPDTLGLEYWSDQVARGVPINQIAAGFLTAPEGQARAGALGNGDFVQQLYQATFHRAADPGGLSYWTNQLAAGTSRADVAAGFSLSAEHISNLGGAYGTGVFVPDVASSEVARIYYAVLNRAPDASGLTYWANQVRQGASVDAVTQAFLGAPEVQVRTGGLTNAQYVDAVYQNALGRPAEASGLAYWTDQLNHGASRVGVTTTIAESAEAQVHLVGQIEQGFYLVM